MPQIASAVVTAFKAVATWTAATMKAGGWKAFALQTAATAAISVGVTLLTMPSPGAAQPSKLDFKADPDAPISFVLGRGAVGGNIVHANVHGGNNGFLTYIVVLSGGGPIDAIEQFRANDAVVSFTTDSGEGAAGGYQNRMWRKASLGEAGAPALAMTATGTKDTPADHGPLADWTAAHRLSGFAHVMWTMLFDPSGAYPTGVPKPMWVVRGLKVYDPRQDSTYPGGSGSQRWGQSGTYAWSQNPYVHALNWLLGYWQNGKRVGGCGVPMSAIDVEAFVEGMNAADANGWRTFAVPSTAMNKWSVLAALLQAGGGTPVPRGAMISCLVNTPKASIATVTSADLAGEVVVETTAGWRDRANKIVPKYVSEVHGWETVAASAVTRAEYVAEDGGERSREVPYEYVADVQQVTELAALDLATLREHKTVTLALKPHLMDLHPGSAFTLDLPDAGVSNQKFVVVRRRFDPATFVSTITARLETDSKHAWAFSLTGTSPYVPPALVTAEDLGPPGAEAWEVSGGAVTSSSGSSTPAIIVTGESDHRNATGMIVAYRRQGATEWLVGYQGLISSRIEIAGRLAASTVYEVEIGYRLGNGQSTGRRAYPPVTTGGLVSGGLVDQGELANEDYVWLGPGGRVFREDRLSVLTDAAVVTSVGTAAAIAGQGWGATASLAEAANSQIAPGNNQLFNASIQSTNGFNVWAGNTGAAITLQRNPPGSFGQNNVVSASAAGAPAAGSYFDLNLGGSSEDGQARINDIAVRPGDRIEAQAAVAVMSMTSASLRVAWYDRDAAGLPGAYLSETVVASGGRIGGGALGLTENFDLLGGFATAPAGASFARLFVRGFCDGQASPTILATRFLQSRAAADQSVLTPWHPGREANPGATVGARFGTNVRRPDGTSASDAAYHTASGTAAAIAGQGPGATALARDVLNYSDEAGSVRVSRPGGGVVSYTSSAVTGALKIRLPVAFNSRMLRFAVDIFDYATGRMQTYVIGGYNYAGTGAGGYWVNVSAHFVGREQDSKPVYFGCDGVGACVWIGTPTSSWSYLTASVRDFLSRNGTSAEFVAGWLLGLDTNPAVNAAPGSGQMASVAKPRAGDAVYGENVFEGSAGAVATLANFRTNLGTAAAFAGQGALATLNSVSYGSANVTGFGSLAARANVRLGNEVVRANGSTIVGDSDAITSLGTAAAIAGQGALATLSSVSYGSANVTGFGSLAARANARLGNEVVRANGSTIVGDSDAITSLGTAAAIAGQGSLATLNSVSYGSANVTGFGSLAARANVRLGNEVVRANGSTVVGDADAITSLGTAAAIAGQGALATKSLVETADVGDAALTAPKYQVGSISNQGEAAFNYSGGYLGTFTANAWKTLGTFQISKPSTQPALLITRLPIYNNDAASNGGFLFELEVGKFVSVRSEIVWIGEELVEHWYTTWRALKVFSDYVPPATNFYKEYTCKDRDVGSVYEEGPFQTAQSTPGSQVRYRWRLRKTTSTGDPRVLSPTEVDYQEIRA